MKNQKTFIKVSAALLSIFMYAGCGATKFKFKASESSKAETHNELLEEINGELPSGEDPRPTPSPGPAPNPEPGEPHSIQIAPQMVKQCAVGDIDIMSIVHTCQPGFFILTVKDQTGEKVLWRYNPPPLQPSDDVSISSALSTSLATSVQGNEFDIFICLDTNGNGQCGDEHIGSTANLDRNALNGLFTCKGSMVFYHRHHSFSGAATSGGEAGNAMQSMLKNLTDTPTTANGVTTFRPQLVQFAQVGNCPMSDRNNGCFAKGTKISVGNNQTAPIETLHVGFPVQLENGQVSVIKKIVTGPESKPMIHFETKSKQKIVVTSEHPLMTKAGMKMAKDITIGDELKTAKGTYTVITSIKQKPYKYNVYNVELEGPSSDDHMIIAEGLVSGDLYLQNKMSGQNKGSEMLQSAK